MNEGVEHLWAELVEAIWKEWACGLLWEDGHQRGKGPIGLRTMLVASRRFRSHFRNQIIPTISHSS